MSNFIEPPPKEKGMGCLGKGCLILIAFVVLLIIAFVIGFYVGTKPKPIPEVQTSEQEQNAVRARWEEFDAASRNDQAVSPSTPAPSSADTTQTEATPAAATGNRIELTAADVNQLIARGRHTRGKAFVSIENDVARVQLQVPLDKLGFKGRNLNGSFAVRSSPDHSPRNLQISEVSFAGVPDAMVNSIRSAYPIQGYMDDFVSQHGITSCTIENGRVILETTGPR